jgi:hypothetical protein
MDESEKQDEKHDDPGISTFHAISIDFRDEDENENADDSIPIPREFDSNGIDERDLQTEKQNVSKM